MLATKSQPSLEGSEWEQVFAHAIAGEWKPSSVGLDDIVKGNCAWGAKSVKNSSPFTVSLVRLISGRNNPEYSFGYIEDSDDGIGRQVLGIWNERVDQIRNRYAHARNVVLIKGSDWTEFSIFELETLRFQPELFEWRRNRQNNLEGYDIGTNDHRFTWQRHGSQFTIIEQVPSTRLKLKIRLPPPFEVERFLDSIGFDSSWVQIVS